MRRVPRSSAPIGPACDPRSAGVRRARPDRTSRAVPPAPVPDRPASRPIPPPPTPDDPAPRPRRRPHLRDGDFSAWSGGTPTPETLANRGIQPEDGTPLDILSSRQDRARMSGPGPRGGVVFATMARARDVTHPVFLFRDRIILRSRLAGQGLPPIPGGGGGRRERGWIFLDTEGVAGTAEGIPGAVGEAAPPSPAGPAASARGPANPRGFPAPAGFRPDRPRRLFPFFNIRRLAILTSPPIHARIAAFS